MTSATLAMELVGEVLVMGRIVPPAHREYRKPFQSCAMELVMRFLAMRDIPHDGIKIVSELIRILIGTIGRGREL
jgi:hypothetical protein